MSATDAVDRETVLSWTNKIPWATYVGTRAAGSGEEVFLSDADVRAIRRFAMDGGGSSMAELLATKDEVSEMKGGSGFVARWRGRSVSGAA